ncbi:MAG: hypothetical protein M3442_10700 [Chloroflexota bacterium]|nr:hypothetical protein [Chloroflexota bacterium]
MPEVLPEVLPAEELSVLRRWFGWRDAPHALRRHFNDIAFGQLRRREAEVAGLRTAGDWRRRQAAVRETLQAVFGPFPERTALNPRVTGVAQRGSYRVEKVIFESRPAF